MPELPEVETIRRRLCGGDAHCPGLIGRRIQGAWVGWARTLAEPAPPAFRRRVRGQTIQRIERRAKHLLLGLSRDTLMIHLGMSGSLHLRRGRGDPGVTPRVRTRIHRVAEDPARYCRLSLRLSGGWRLDFDDPRKFGRVRLVSDPARVLSDIGPEPLSREFTAAALAARLRDHRRGLKPLLLDQSFIAGVGNIYADEALHRAGLHPRTRSDRLTPAQARALWRAIRAVLREAIRWNGTTFDAVYGDGAFQRHLRVYQRTGLPCRRCGTLIRRIVVGQRGTHFCPRCQPLRGARDRC
jgi:formamidopyrimidine-DNA glycosylase